MAAIATWEYLVVEMAGDATSMMTSNGILGWELMAVQPVGCGFYRYVFKREKLATVLAI